MAREKDNIALSDEHNTRGIELADRGWLDEAIKEFKKASREVQDEVQRAIEDEPPPPTRPAASPGSKSPADAVAQSQDES